MKELLLYIFLIGGVVFLAMKALPLLFALVFYLLMGFFCMSMWFIDAVGTEQSTSGRMAAQVLLWPVFFVVTGICILTGRR